MDDLSDEIRRRVEAARQFDTHQREEKQQQVKEQAELQEQRKARARELSDEIAQKLRHAADASDGAMRYEPAGGGSASSHILIWQAPRPQRALEVTVDHHNGLIGWGWTTDGRSIGPGYVDALNFDVASIDGLILYLADQDAWSRGGFPSKS